MGIRSLKARFRKSFEGTDLKSHPTVRVEEIFPSSEFSIPRHSDVFGRSCDSFRGYVETIPSAYVAAISNGRCIVGREEVYSQENKCFESITSQLHNPAIGQRVPKVSRKISGNVAQLSLSGLEANYYHFCVEWMARLYLLQQAPCAIDYYIVDNQHSFQREYLKLLGISEKKVLTANKGEYLEAETLWVPSLINNWRAKDIRGHTAYLKKWLPSWVGEVYSQLVPPLSNQESAPSRKIYISRKAARYRKIENEEAVVELLSQLGFEEHSLEGMTVAEQRALFSSACCIVSIHGAGLVNMIHCQQTALIFELFPAYYHDPSYRLQAYALGHHYEYMVGETKNTDVSAQQEDVNIPIKDFESALRSLADKYQLWGEL